MSLRLDSHLLESALAISHGAVFVAVLEITVGDGMLLEHLVFRVEVKDGGLLFGLFALAFLDIERRLDFLVRLGKDQVVREVVWLVILDSGGNLVNQHREERRRNLSRHVDESLGEDKADVVISRQQRRHSGQSVVGLGLVDEVFENISHGSLVFVGMRIEDRQHSVGIGALAIGLDCRADGILRQDQVGQLRHVELVGVDVKQLAEQRLDTVEVDLGVEVEPLEVNIDIVEILFPNG